MSLISTHWEMCWRHIEKCVDDAFRDVLMTHWEMYWWRLGEEQNLHWMALNLRWRRSRVNNFIEWNRKARISSAIQEHDLAYSDIWTFFREVLKWKSFRPHSPGAYSEPCKLGVQDDRLCLQALLRREVLCTSNLWSDEQWLVLLSDPTKHINHFKAPFNPHDVEPRNITIDEVNRMARHRTHKTEAFNQEYGGYFERNTKCRPVEYLISKFSTLNIFSIPI